MKELLPIKPGVYTLIFEIDQLTRVKIGKLGCYNFPRGLYAYTGSALGSRSSSLNARVSRHLMTGKRQHWHIDYLLNSHTGKVKAVIYALTVFKVECQIAKELDKSREINFTIRGFGCSDCRAGCMSHLHYANIDLKTVLDRAVEAYEKIASNSVFQRIALKLI